MTQHYGVSCTQARTPTPPRRQSTPLAVVHARQQAELAEAEVAAVWAGQLASALEMNQDLEGTILSLRQQNTNLKRCLPCMTLLRHLLTCMAQPWPGGCKGPECVIYDALSVLNRMLTILPHLLTCNAVHSHA